MPYDPLGRGGAARNIDDESNDQIGEVDSPIESVRKSGEVAVGVLGVAECPVRARQHGLKVNGTYFGISATGGLTQVIEGKRRWQTSDR